MNPNALYKLLSWFSSVYPIGSFNYSHGLEYAIERDLIKTREQLEEWIRGVILFGTGRVDALLFKTGYDLLQNGMFASEVQLNELIFISNAFKTTPELWTESYRQGEAALKILIDTYDFFELKQLQNQLKKLNKKPVLAVVFGIACAACQLPFEESLCSFLHAFISNVVMAGTKLIPLGQTDSQKIIMNLQSSLVTLIRQIQELTLEDIGSATPMLDWTSAHHETQYTRLFQS